MQVKFQHKKLTSNKSKANFRKTKHVNSSKQIFKRIPLTQAIASALTVVSLSVCSLSVLAGPQGGNVVAGSASIQQTSATRTDIVQQSQRAVVNWDSFNVGTQEHVNFQQPSSSAATLNRVTGGDVSNILGRMTANGQVYLVNPNGVYFGKTAKIDVGGLVASTSNIGTNNFMTNTLNFDDAGNGHGRIVNEGEISIADGGLAAFVAPSVENAGAINARLGRVVLASGEQFTLDLYGDELISLTVPDSVIDQLTTADGQPVSALISQSGTINAEGGQVILTASAARQLVDHVINMEGVITANSASLQNGEIVLSGGDEGSVNVSGTLSAVGDNSNETGGSIQVLGDLVLLDEGANINVSGDAGGGTALIGGDYQGKGDTPTATTTKIASTAQINADAKTKGNGGKVIVWADETTIFNGTISGRGGSQNGDGGFAEVSGKNKLLYKGTTKLSASNGKAGTLLLDPDDVTISDPANDDETVGTISAKEINDHLFLGTNVVIQANNNVVINEEINSLYSDVKGKANLTLTATNQDVTINAPIKLQGKLTATAGNNVVVKNDIAAFDGVDMTATSGVINLHADMQSSGANITFNSDVIIEPDRDNQTYSLITEQPAVNFGAADSETAVNDAIQESKIYQITISTGGEIGEIKFLGTVTPSVPLTDDEIADGQSFHINEPLKDLDFNTDSVSGKIFLEYVALNLKAKKVSFDNGLARDRLTVKDNQGVDVDILSDYASKSEIITYTDFVYNPDTRSFDEVEVEVPLIVHLDSYNFTNEDSVTRVNGAILFKSLDNNVVFDSSSLEVDTSNTERPDLRDYILRSPDILLNIDATEVTANNDLYVGKNNNFNITSGSGSIVSTGIITSIRIATDSSSALPSAPSLNTNSTFPTIAANPSPPIVEPPPPITNKPEMPPISIVEDPGYDIDSELTDYNTGNSFSQSGGQGVGSNADMGKRSSKQGAAQDVFLTASHVVEGDDGSGVNDYLVSDPYSWSKQSSSDGEDEDNE